MKTVLFLLAVIIPATVFGQHSDMYNSLEADARASAIRNQLIINDGNRRQDMNALKKQLGEIQTSSDYDGPSPFTTPWIRSYFGGSGQQLDPALAAELERRLAPCGAPKKHQTSATGFGPLTLMGGEFRGKPVDVAVATIKAQFASRAPAQGAQVPRGSLTTETSANFWAEKARQKAQVAQASQPASASSQKLMAVDASNSLPYEVTPANLDVVQQHESAMKQEDFEAAVKSSHARVAQAFPAYLDDKSPIHAKANKVYDDCTKANSKVVEVSDCPWIVYSVAAQQLGIKPATP